MPRLELGLEVNDEGHGYGENLETLNHMSWLVQYLEHQNTGVKVSVRMGVRLSVRVWVRVEL